MSVVPERASKQAVRRIPRVIMRQPRRWLAGASIALAMMGLPLILSASSVEARRAYGSSYYFFWRQVIWFTLGLVAMVVLATIDYRKLRRFARFGLIVTVLALIAVIIPGVGSSRGGASRWIEAGPFSFQPSEMAKLALIFFAAHVLERKNVAIMDRRELAVPVLPATALVAFLVVIQPDLGTAIICVAAVFIVMFLSGARFSHLGLLVAAGLPLLGALSLSAAYRRERVLSFLDPWSDPLNTGYQTIQGQIALGSGGWFGVGIGASRQKFSYLPNAHTDFVFAILGEEAGLVGTFIMLTAFTVLIYAGFRVARAASDRFGMMLAGGITGWLGVQAAINMGAVLGLVPVTGVPLPLVSYGGSALIFTMAALGLVISVGRRSG